MAFQIGKRSDKLYSFLLKPSAASAASTARDMNVSVYRVLTCVTLTAITIRESCRLESVSCERAFEK